MNEEQRIPKIYREMRSTIIGNVMAIMGYKGYDREKMAALLGVSKTTFDNRLNGKLAWTCDEIATIANIAKVSPEDIVRRAF